MIDLDAFTKFFTDNFESNQLYIDRFKPNVLIVDVDCLADGRKLTIRATDEKIEFSTISKAVELDFSLYDFSVLTQKEAEDLIARIKDARMFFIPEVSSKERAKKY